MQRLLSDEGDSLRRLAASGVGSRYWQISKEGLDAYLPTLRKLSKQREEHPDVGYMADRAIGPLTAKYSGELFVPSPDGKWVIYERYSVPCHIDLHRKFEELLGWEQGGSLFGFGSAFGGCTLNGSVFWETKSRAVALLVEMSRRDETLWF